MIARDGERCLKQFETHGRGTLTRSGTACYNADRRLIFMLRSSCAPSRSARLLLPACVLGLALVATARPEAQFEKMVSTTFDGWNQLPDGSYELVFGYMNRNSSEIEVPLGDGNKVEPGPGGDQGQPTNFLPGRQRAAFRIPVPAAFKGKYTWTLTYAGATQTATGSIDQNYSLDVGDPEPPRVKAGADLTVKMSGVAHLTPSVLPPEPAPAPSAPATVGPEIVARRARGERLTVWWSKYRGPGTVTFGGDKPAAAPPGPTGRDFPLGSFRLTCAAPIPATCGANDATFSAPGTYWLRVVAAERSASNAIVKVVVTP